MVRGQLSPEREKSKREEGGRRKEGGERREERRDRTLHTMFVFHSYLTLVSNYFLGKLLSFGRMQILCCSSSIELC